MADTTYTDDDLEQKLKDAATAKGVTYDKSDLEDIQHRDNSQAGLDAAMKKYDFRANNTPNDGDNNNGNPNPWEQIGGGPRLSTSSGVHASTPTQQWSSAGNNGGLFPDWYRELMTRQISDQESAAAENKSRSNALYSTLNDRASQGLNVSGSDPIIKGQVDSYRAEQDRAARNDISNVAEQAGPYANIRGEQRMANEHVGQATGGFQAQLIGQELQSRRNEIAQALSSEGAMLSGDQQRTLQSQLATMDQAIAEANAKTNSASVANQFTLGQGQLALGNRSLDVNNDQFMRELALRQWDLDNQHSLGWASL